MSEAIEYTQIERTVMNVRDKFVSIADRHRLVTWAEESQFALQSCERNPELMKCDAVTIQDAIINVAAVGLTLNPAHQYAYLVPEYNKGANRKECQLRISFKGLIKIATDSGAVKWVKADVIHEKDKFVYHGPNAMPEIAMEPFADRGKPVGVYCIAKTHEDEYLVDTAPWSDVEKARNAAKTDSVWKAWPEEMAKKFIIKRASKQWSKTDRAERLSTAVDVVNRSEGSEEFELIEYEPPRSTSVASMVLDGVDVDPEIIALPEMAMRGALHKLANEEIDRAEAKALIADAARDLSAEAKVALWRRFDSKERSAFKKIGGI